MSDRHREWLDAMRPADEAITEWVVLHGWDQWRCETECGRCWVCGHQNAYGWIDALLSNPDLLAKAREKHAATSPTHDAPEEKR